MKSCFGIIAAVSLAPFAHAGVVSQTNISSLAGDIVVTDSAFNPLASGIAATGYFTTGFDVAAAAVSQDFAALVSNFNILTSAQIGSTVGDFGVDVAGFYGSSVDYGAPGALLGSILYTMFGDGPSLATSGAFGLVDFNGLAIGPDTPLPDSNNATLAASGGWNVLVGSVGPNITIDGSAVLGAGNESVSVGTFALVPEPSVALLGALGVLGLVRRRR